MKPVRIFSFLGISLVFGVFCAPQIAQAVDVQNKIYDQMVAVGAGAGVEAADRVNDPRIIAAEIIKIVLSILGSIFFILLIMSGYWLVTARGDEGKVEKAQTTIRSSIIGLAVIIAAYGITIFVTTRVLVSTQPATRGGEPSTPRWTIDEGFQY